MRKKATSESGRPFRRLSPEPITENNGGDGNLGDGLAKEESCNDMFGLLSPKTTVNLCFGLMNVSYISGFAPGEVVRRRRRPPSW